MAPILRSGAAPKISHKIRANVNVSKPKTSTTSTAKPTAKRTAKPAAMGAAAKEQTNKGAAKKLSTNTASAGRTKVTPKIIISKPQRNVPVKQQKGVGKKVGLPNTHLAGANEAMQQRQLQRIENVHLVQEQQHLKQSQANYIIHPPHINRKPKQQIILPPYVRPHQIKQIIESIPIKKECSNLITILVLLPTKEQRLFTFCIPRACTILEILEEVLDPFEHGANIQVTEVNLYGVNYVVAIGNVLNLPKSDLEMGESSVGSTTNQSCIPQLQPQQLAQLQRQPQVQSAKPPAKSSRPDIPKLVPDKLAVCGFCGYINQNFDKCLRCRRKLPDNVKMISTLLTTQVKNPDEKTQVAKKHVPLANKASNKFSGDIMTEGSHESILEELECPICNEYMSPPIKQCSIGHSLCNICFSSVEMCPLCKQSLSKARNISLEKIFLKRFDCCKFKEAGCKFASLKLNNKDLVNHESNCEFDLKQCPLACDSTMPYKRMEYHFMTNHVVNFFRKSKLMVIFRSFLQCSTKEACDVHNIHFNTTFKYILCTCEQLFLCRIHKDITNRKIKMAVFCIQERILDKRFYFEIRTAQYEQNNLPEIILKYPCFSYWEHNCEDYGISHDIDIFFDYLDCFGDLHLDVSIHSQQ